MSLHNRSFLSLSCQKFAIQVIEIGLKIYSGLDLSHKFLLSNEISLKKNYSTGTKVYTSKIKMDWTFI
jgi:hypothetical protein